MKVNANIYWSHSASFQSHVHEQLSREFNTHGWRRLLHNISTGSGSDLISDQYAIFPQGFETRFVDQVAIAPVLTVSNHEI